MQYTCIDEASKEIQTGKREIIDTYTKDSKKLAKMYCKSFETMIFLNEIHVNTTICLLTIYKVNKNKKSAMDKFKMRIK